MCAIFLCLPLSHLQHHLSSNIMPAITAGKVLVTGANGYIATWVVKSLLDKGFSVRGTVRSESKVAHLKDTFKGLGDKFEVVVVPDITKVSLV